jgi:hypothetical protein
MGEDAATNDGSTFMWRRVLVTCVIVTLSSLFTIGLAIALAAVDRGPRERHLTGVQPEEYFPFVSQVDICVRSIGFTHNDLFHSNKFDPVCGSEANFLQALRTNI